MKCKRKSVGGPGAREERARGGLAALALALAVALTMMPGRAWADVLDLPSIDGVTGDNVGWVYPYGPSQGCAALAEVLGYNWYTLSSEVQNRILTEDVDFGYNPFTYIIETVNNQPNVPKFYNLQDTMDGIPVLNEVTTWITSTFGLNNVWAFNISDSDMERAKAHMEKWVFPREPVDPEPSGDGNAGYYNSATGAVRFVPGGDVQSFTIDGINVYNRETHTVYANEINGTFGFGNSNQLECNGKGIIAIMFFGNMHFYYGDASDFEVVYSNNIPIGLRNITEEAKTIYYRTTYSNPISYISRLNDISPIELSMDFTYNGTLGTGYGNGVKTIQPNGTQSFTYHQDFRAGWVATVYGSETIGGEPGYDPEIRPDDPPEPPEPDVPGYDPVTPGTHTHDDNDTYITVKVSLDTWNTVYYTITQINNNTQTTYNDPSSGSDVLDVIRNWYSDWQHHTQDLKQWFDHMQAQLVDSLQKLNEGFNLSIWNGVNALRSAIDDQNQQIVDAANNISNNLDEMGEWIVTELDEIITGAINAIGEYFEDAVQSLEDFLQQVAEYLVKSLNFEFDDGGIKSLLQRILRKIPGNTAAPDVGLDPDGFWDWLTRMFEEFFEGLIDDATDGIEDVAEGLLGLATKFPFSIPWDIYAILTLFVAEPVTPVFDFPMPVPEVVDQQGYVELEVDLSPYDDVAAVLRHLQTLAFIIWICGEIPGWLNQLKIGTGGNKDD